MEVVLQAILLTIALFKRADPYDSENETTFDRWIRRHENRFKLEAFKQEDAATVRFLLPRVIDLAETIHTSRRMFGPHKSDQQLKTSKTDITLIELSSSSVYTSHGVQESFCQLQRPRTASNHLPDPKQEGEKQPSAKSSEIFTVIPLATRSSTRKFVSINNNGVATLRWLDTGVSSARRKLAQPGLQPSSNQTIDTHKQIRPARTKSRSANTSPSPTISIKEGKQYNSWRWEAATVIKKIGRLKRRFSVVSSKQSRFTNDDHEELNNQLNPDNQATHETIKQHDNQNPSKHHEAASTLG